MCDLIKIRGHHLKNIYYHLHNLFKKGINRKNRKMWLLSKAVDGDIFRTVDGWAYKTRGYDFFDNYLGVLNKLHKYPQQKIFIVEGLDDLCDACGLKYFKEGCRNDGYSDLSAREKFGLVISGVYP